MKFLLIVLTFSFIVNSGFTSISEDKIDPIKIKNEIYYLRVKCKDLDIRSSKEIFKNYYNIYYTNLGTSSVADLQEAIIQGAKHNVMRITFQDEINYGDLMFVVPFDVLEDFKVGKLENDYQSMLEQNRMEDRIMEALLNKEIKEKPLLIINGQVADPNIIMDGKKYTASSLTILPPNIAVEKYGKVALHGAVEYTNLKFRDE